jgi:glycosyltransferase involved in cell wall biosynthesis
MLHDENFIFDFLYFDEAKKSLVSDISELGGKCYKVESPKKILKFAKSLNEFAEKHVGEYDIMHLHDPFMISFFYVLKSKCNISKVIAHAHSTQFSNSKLGNIRNAVLSFPNRFLADELWACSKSAGYKIFGKRFRKGNIIYNAIDARKYIYNSEKREKTRKELGLDNKLVIGHVGGFARPKNHIFLLNVFCEILKINPEAVLLLVGDGKLKQNIIEETKRMKIEKKVIMLGRQKSVERFLCAMDVFVFPSIFEGLGISLVEAQTSGLPCVFSDIIPEEANIIVANNKVMSLVETPEKWAKAILEAKILNRNNDCYQEIVKGHFDINYEAYNLYKLYAKVMRG